MNTLGWHIAIGSNDHYLALHENTALMADILHRGSVWQYHSEGFNNANDWLVYKTAFLENEGGKLIGEPVEFDLTADAIREINGTNPGTWTYASVLRNELIAAIEPPSVFSSHMIWHATTPPRATAPGDTHFDASRGVVKVWTGTSWSTLGTVNAKTLGIEMSPEGRG